MGQVKDIYFNQMQAGDEFTGWCISLLNILSANFASSPAFFDENTDKEVITAKELTNLNGEQWSAGFERN
jgi:hypothetical protein